VSGLYECDARCGHRHDTDAAADVVLPPLPASCIGLGWRLLSMARPTVDLPGFSSGYTPPAQ
jgi:hypothetical protein